MEIEATRATQSGTGVVREIGDSVLIIEPEDVWDADDPTPASQQPHAAPSFGRAANADEPTQQPPSAAQVLDLRRALRKARCDVAGGAVAVTGSALWALALLGAAIYLLTEIGKTEDEGQRGVQAIVVVFFLAAVAGLGWAIYRVTGELAVDCQRVPELRDALPNQPERAPGTVV